MDHLAISCDFEDSDFCSFFVYGSDKFNFTIKQGEEFGSPDEGPQTDDEGNTKGHFTYIKSGVSGTEEGSSSIIQTDMIEARNHLIECFEFKVAMKKDGGVRSISVIQQDEELEDKPGRIEEMWFLSSEQVNNSEWFTASFEARAHYLDDIPQNYTVNILKTFSYNSILYFTPCTFR